MGNSEISDEQDNSASSDSDSTATGGCMMGPSWFTYIICIIIAIAFIILVIWLTSFWSTDNCQTQNKHKSALSQFSNNSVTAAK